MSTSHLQPLGSRPDLLVNAAPYDLTIRFSASLPDLALTVPSNRHATTCTLKQLIRASLPAELKERRIRLIYAGKALADEALLGTVLKRIISHPPSRSPTPGPYDDSDNSRSTSKGKVPVRDPPTTPRIYIHCSIGDVVLSSKELAAEAALVDRSTSSDHLTAERAASQKHGEETTTAPTPRGFDRLLSAGFTAAEVHSLRLQFMAIQAHTHTPDTMPSPDVLRDMEERWLDNGGGVGTGSIDGAGGPLDEDIQSGALDDMLWGLTMGFFWPIGCLFWGMREEGIWSQRRKMAVVVGATLNMIIGLLRYTDP